MIESASPPLQCAVFGLEQEPFLDGRDDACFFPSDQHLRALELMGRALWSRARVGVVIAEHGCGKSLLVRRLLKQLDERIVVAAVQRERLDPREFLLDILKQFGIALDEHDKTDRRRLLERFLAHQATLGRICLVIVENPQSMHPSVLEELRCLATLEAEGERVLKLLLLGQPALNLVLESPRMAQLLPAHTPRLVLGPLSEDQTAAYVAHRLRVAGARNPDELMPYTLMAQIHACTLGVPGNINRLCQRALDAAAREGSPQVTPMALDTAIAELGWGARRLQHQPVAHSLPAVLLPEQPPARLLITMQGLADREVTLAGGRMLIGRGEEADVRIDSVFVSRYHALLVRDRGRDLLLDLGSTNGLLVNSQRILRRALRHRDLIQVGPARVTYLNEQMTEAQVDPGETVCFARPGFAAAAGDDETATVLAFGRLDDAS